MSDINLREITQEEFDKRVLENELDFRGCKLFDLKITGDFYDADFRNARISECLIEAAVFKGANFNNTVISGETMRACSFENVNFDSAHIYGIMIENSIFDNCNFEKAKFTNMVFAQDVVLKACNFEAVFVDRASFHISQENMQNPRNYETIKFTRGGSTEKEIEDYKQNILQLMGNVQLQYSCPDYAVEQPDRKKEDQISVHQKKQQEHNRSL